MEPFSAAEGPSDNGSVDGVTETLCHSSKLDVLVTSSNMHLFTEQEHNWCAVLAKMASSKDSSHSDEQFQETCNKVSSWMTQLHANNELSSDELQRLKNIQLYN